MKKTILILLAIIFYTTSVAFAYVYGGSNLSLGTYPEFDYYLPYNPSRYDMELFIKQAQEYLDNCDNDINRIYEAKQETIDKVNYEINRYNNGY
mgnify:FL=1